MPALLERIESLIKTPHSEDTPGQVAAVASGIQLPVFELPGIPLRAERRVRDEVDWIVDEKAEPVRREAAAVRTEAETGVALERARLDEVEQRLQAELKRLTSPVDDLIKLPKVRFA
jgi:hypothetical protein